MDKRIIVDVTAYHTEGKLWQADETFPKRTGMDHEFSLLVVCKTAGERRWIRKQLELLRRPF